jgi:hypothetical protein
MATRHPNYVIAMVVTKTTFQPTNQSSPFVDQVSMVTSNPDTVLVDCLEVIMAGMVWKVLLTVHLDIAFMTLQGHLVSKIYKAVYVNKI